MSPKQEEERDDRAEQTHRALGIERSQPGPNSFAMAEVQRGRYMMQGNAFYQQEWLARQDSAPLDRNTTHPAFTQPDLISNLSQPIPRLPPANARPQQPSAPPRESNVTTMSPFLRAAQSPELNLGTTPDNTPRPTQRAFLEERVEEERHQQSGATEERIPVFRPTPRPNKDRFESSAMPDRRPAMPSSRTNMPNSRTAMPARNATEPVLAAAAAERETVVKFADEPETDNHPASTPKKSSFFDRFKKKDRRFDGLPPPPKSPAPPSSGGSRMPPKAAQLLEKTPKKNKSDLPRSPSKTKGFFSRRTSDFNELIGSSKKKNDGDNRELPRSQSSFGHYGDTGSQNTRTPIQGGSERGRTPQSQFQGTPGGGLTRHQSLKYFDSSIPPTPPSKDTPEDNKVVHHITKQQSPVLTFTSDTPTRSTGFLSASPRLSSTRSGSYGQRQVPQLVTAPSMHSIRASVVPGEMDPGVVQEMNTRVGGLGLEGFSMPSETDHRASHVYSPSIYSDDWDVGPRATAAIPPRINEGDEDGISSLQPPRLFRHSRSMSATTQSTALTSRTIDIVYPDLQNDPSIVDFQKFEPTPPEKRAARTMPGATPTMSTAFKDLENTLDATMAPTTDGAEDGQPALATPTPAPGDRRVDRPLRSSSLARVPETQTAPTTRTVPATRPAPATQSPPATQTAPATRPPSGPLSSGRQMSSSVFQEAVREAAAERESGPKTPRTDNDESHIHPAFRHNFSVSPSPSPIFSNSSAQVSPLRFGQADAPEGQTLPATFYDPEGTTFPGRAQNARRPKQDEGVEKMREALKSDSEDESPVPRRQARGPNVMANRPTLTASSGGATRGTQGGRGRGRAGTVTATPCNQDVNADVDPQKPPPERPIHAPSTSGRSKTSRGAQLPSSRTDQQQHQAPRATRSAASLAPPPTTSPRDQEVNTSRCFQTPRDSSSPRSINFSRPSPPSQQRSFSNTRQPKLVDDSVPEDAGGRVLQQLNQRNHEIRDMTEEMRFNNSTLDRVLSRTRKANSDTGADDSGVDINDYKRNSGAGTSGTQGQKRVSTSSAHRFYGGTPKTKDAGTPDSKDAGTPNATYTDSSEASTIIQTPNLPSGFQRPSGGGPVTSSALAGYNATGTSTQAASGSSSTMTASAGHTTSTTSGGARASAPSASNTTARTSTASAGAPAAASSGQAASRHSAPSTMPSTSAATNAAPSTTSGGQTAPSASTSATTNAGSGTAPPSTAPAASTTTAANTNPGVAPPSTTTAATTNPGAAPPHATIGTHHAPAAANAQGNQAQQVANLASAMLQHQQMLNQVAAQLQQMQATQQANFTQQLMAPHNQHAISQALQHALQVTFQQAAPQPAVQQSYTQQGTQQGTQQAQPQTATRQQAATQQSGTQASQQNTQQVAQQTDDSYESSEEGEDGEDFINPG